MAKFKIKLNDDIIRVILLIVGSVFSTLVLALSVIIIIDINNGDYSRAPRFLFWIFVSLSFIRLVTFIKDRSKINFIRCMVLLAVDIGIGITVLFANNNPYLFSVTGGLYCLTIVLSRIFSLIQKHTLRSIVFNAIIILFVILMAVGILIPRESLNINDVVIVECLFIAVVSFFEVASYAFGQLKFKVLFKIIFRTYSLEVIFGLLTLIVASSLCFMVYEPTITSFGDALWYSFAVVTTIGFGDFAAETLVGRILTVMLGVYGLIVVAIITSIIVNFYNEVNNKENAQTFKDIKNEEKDKK